MPTLFQLSNWISLPFWLLMIFAPRWVGTRRMVAAAVPVGLLAAVYALLVLPRTAGLWPELANPDLTGIATLLATPEGATIAWVHFLAFDLFVGRWIYLDSRDRELSTWLAGPVLLLTLMFGPLGYLVYQALCWWISRRQERSETGGAASGPSEAPPFRPGSLTREVVRGLWSENPALLLVGVGGLVLLIPALFGQVLDSRLVTGAPVWQKPAKFLASSSIYALTLSWLLSYVRGKAGLVRWAGNGTAFFLGIELAIILFQAGRGTTSHFNTTATFDAALWGLMGISIMALWLLGLATAIALSRQRDLDPVFGASLRLGLGVTLLGMAEGVLMAAQGGHTVGLPDGGPGLPVLNWSTVGGDLRVPHFAGLHALQVIPAIGILLTRWADPRLTEGHRVHLVRIAAGAYGVLVLLLTWQALRGQSIVAPDTLSAAVFGCWALVSGLSVTSVLRKAWLARTPHVHSAVN